MELYLIVFFFFILSFDISSFMTVAIMGDNASCNLHATTIILKPSSSLASLLDHFYNGVRDLLKVSIDHIYCHVTCGQ